MEYKFLNALPSPCLLLDLNGQVLFSNDRYKAISCLTCSDVHESYCGGGHREITEVIVDIFLSLKSRQSLPQKGPVGHPVTITLMDSRGTEFSFDIEFSLVDWNGPKSVLCLLRDVTSYKKIELELDKKEEFLWLLMFNLPIGLIFVRADTCLVEDLNLEAANLLGTKREFVLNKNCKEIFLCENPICLLNKEGKDTYRGESFLLRADGENIPILRTVKLLNTGDSEVIMEAFLDLSERKSLEERLKNLSITDPLTGAYNRRYFVERLEHEIGRFKRYGDQFSVIMLDLDHFKSINDDFGHDKGDEVLVGTVSTIKSRIRSIDVLARWGGEEFVLLLPQTDKEGAYALAEDLRLKLREKDYSIGRKVTASFGITSIFLGDTVDTIMKRADDMLYTAKASGRDCVMQV